MFLPRWPPAQQPEQTFYVVCQGGHALGYRPDSLQPQGIDRCAAQRGQDLNGVVLPIPVGVFPQLIELEVAAVLGADRHERSEDRLGYRNGNRPRLLATQVGDTTLLIPKLRADSFLLSILEPRRRVDQALYGVVMEAYIGGISTRTVDALVAVLGVQSGISKSQVSRICADIDIQVQAFLNRPLQESGYAYVFLDATYLHGRLGLGQQVCSRAAVIAMGVNADGRRELLGLQVGDSESEGFWKTFIGSLKEPGLTGVKLVVSDAHVGLIKAICKCFRAVAGSASGFISPETCCSGSQKPTRAWSPLLCARCSSRRTPLGWWSAGMTWPAPLLSASSRLMSSCSSPRRTCLRSATSRSTTGARSGAPTCSSG